MGNASLHGRAYDDDYNIKDHTLHAELLANKEKLAKHQEWFNSHVKAHKSTFQAVLKKSSGKLKRTSFMLGNLIRFRGRRLLSRARAARRRTASRSSSNPGRARYDH